MSQTIRQLKLLPCKLESPLIQYGNFPIVIPEIRTIYLLFILALDKSVVQKFGLYLNPGSVLLRQSVYDYKFDI